MYCHLFIVAAALAMTVLPANAQETGVEKELTLERIFADPALEGPSPRALKYAPDGSRVTYLKGSDDDAQRLDLWQHHVASGEDSLLVAATELLGGESENLSDEEKARRERQRMADLSGIVEYQWAPSSDALLFPLAGDLYLYRLNAEQPIQRLTDDGNDTFATDPKVSPQGSHVSFVRDQNLHLIDLESGRVRAATQAGGGAIKLGMAEFVAQEEMDRDTGYWWAPDDRYMVVARVDESPVDIAQRHEIYGDEIKVIEQRYPYTGEPNVRVDLGVLEVASGEMTWLDLGDEKDIYLARVGWLPDGSGFFVQRQSRDQKTLDLLHYSVDKPTPRTVLTETSDTWVNLHDDLHFLKKSSDFLWTSERDGFRHIYRYTRDGKLKSQLTRGDWMVAEIKGVDEASNQVYFTATRASPLQRHLYQVPLTGGEITQVTRREGWHEIELAPDAASFVDTFSSRTRPPNVGLFDAAGERLTWLEENPLDHTHPYSPYAQNAAPTRFGTLSAADGQILHYAITTPPELDGDQSYPVMIHVYGGPGVQNVTNSWSRRILFEQYMARAGYVVFALDNRGSAGRGVAFEAPLHRAMGRVEVEDQLVGVEYLRSLDFVDDNRIGIFGWSYGGYMTLMTLFQAPEKFAAGVAVAPVTRWGLYDTHYTERYMGTPKDNAEGYEKAAVFAYADKLDDPLMIIHGMADDNVLFTHSTELFGVLQANAQPFEMMTYPGAKHGISGQASQTHVYRTIACFFDRQLKDRSDSGVCRKESAREKGGGENAL